MYNEESVRPSGKIYSPVEEYLFRKITSPFQSSTDMNTEDIDWLADVFRTYNNRLLALARVRMNPRLYRFMTVEDLVQELYLAAGKRMDYLRREEQVPVFVRLRTLLIQTETDMERRYLACQKRDAYKDTEGIGVTDESQYDEFWNRLADSISSPFSKLAKIDRYELVRNILTNMSETDREILRLRHFEELTNQECASVLNIEPKAASIRYIRALKRLQEMLAEYSEFRS